MASEFGELNTTQTQLESTFQHMAFNDEHGKLRHIDSVPGNFKYLVRTLNLLMSLITTYGQSNRGKSLPFQRFLSVLKRDQFWQPSEYAVSTNQTAYKIDSTLIHIYRVHL